MRWWNWRTGAPKMPGAPFLVVGQRRLWLFHFRRALGFIVQRGKRRRFNRRARMRALKQDATDKMKDYKCDHGRNGERTDAKHSGVNDDLGDRTSHLGWHFRCLLPYRIAVGRFFGWP